MSPADIDYNTSGRRDDNCRGGEKAVEKGRNRTAIGGYSYNRHKQITIAYSSDREPRTFRQLRTPVTTDRKAEKSDLSPRSHKKRISPRIEKSPTRQPRTDNPEKTGKIGKHGNSYRQRPSTVDISPRRMDDIKSYLTNQSPSYRRKNRTESLSPVCCPKTVRHQRKDNVDSDSINSSSSSETDSKKERPVKVCHSKHILKPPKFDGVRSLESFWAQFCNCV